MTGIRSAFDIAVEAYVAENGGIDRDTMNELKILYEMPKINPKPPTGGGKENAQKREEDIANTRGSKDEYFVKAKSIVGELGAFVKKVDYKTEEIRRSLVGCEHDEKGVKKFVDVSIKRLENIAEGCNIIIGRLKKY